MSKIKSLDDYGATILQLSVELSHLPPYHPSFDKKNDRLSRQLSKWSGKLSITIHVANNEKLPYKSSEVGYPCIPMTTIKEGGARQTGDYVAYLNDYDMYCGLVIERKGGVLGVEDLYGTLMNKEQKSRFYREISRYEADPRFNRFILLAECNYEDFLQYVPEIFVFTLGTADETIKKNIERYVKRFHKMDIRPCEFSHEPYGYNVA